MTKAQIIVLDKKVCLLFGLWYNEEQTKYWKKDVLWMSLVSHTALARASRGQLKTQELNQKLSALLQELVEVPVEP